MQNLHAVFTVDRAGLVGEDGETHHGVFDVGYLRQCPGMQVLCPASTQELQDMLTWSVNAQNGPVAIRYPRGGNRGYAESAWLDGRVNACCKGKDAVLITYGVMLENVMQAKEILEAQGISVTVLRLLQVSPLPVEEIISHIPSNVPVCIFEETMASCGIGESLAMGLREHNSDLRISVKNLGDGYIPHGDLPSLYRHCGLDGESIAKFVQEVCSRES